MFLPEKKKTNKQQQENKKKKSKLNPNKQKEGNFCDW